MTRQVVNDTNVLLSALKDAENAQRGVLLTAEDRYLEPYRQAVRDVPPILDRLARIEVERHRADQEQPVERLRPLVKDKLGELSQTIELRRGQRLDAALAIVRTDRGKAIMDQIRALCSEIQQATHALSVQETEEARIRGNETALIAVFGSTAIFVFLVFSTIAIERATRRRQQLIEALQVSEDRIRQSRDWLHTTLASIGDAVITTDAAGKITFLNPAAEQTTGWTSGEAEGKPLEQVFVIRNEDTGREVENPVNRVLRECRVVALANHTKLIAKDGRQIPIDDSAAPIRDAAGRTWSATASSTARTAARREFMCLPAGKAACGASP